MEKDVVCGVQVDERTTAHRADYQGKTFHFCSPSCRTKFGEKPEAYARTGARVRVYQSAVYPQPSSRSKKD